MIDERMPLVYASTTVAVHPGSQFATTEAGHMHFDWKDVMTITSVPSTDKCGIGMRQGERISSDRVYTQSGLHNMNGKQSRGPL